MRTNKFCASIVYGKGQGKFDIIGYPNPIECDRPVTIYNHYRLKINVSEVFDGCFILYKKDNPGLLCNQHGEHYVRDKNLQYKFIVYLEDKGDTLDNEIMLTSTLPVGLKMTRMHDITDGEAYGFTGLNVMLLEQIPNIA
jgi:hypothetical protein